MEKEIWKSVPGYEGLYEVSNLGRVRSLTIVDSIGRTKRGIVLRQKTAKNGYKEVCLHKNGRQKTKKVHRLVAEAFLANNENLPQVNHKDENKGNNLLGNLEWCSAKYNTNYGTGRHRNFMAQHRIPVLQFNGDVEPIGSFPSLREAERKTGVSSASISCVLRGKTKTAGGFIWRRA